MLGSDQIINMHAHEMRGNNCRESTEYQHHSSYIYTPATDVTATGRLPEDKRKSQIKQKTLPERLIRPIRPSGKPTQTSVSTTSLATQVKHTCGLTKSIPQRPKRPRTRSQMRYKVVSIRIHGDTRNVVVCVVHSAGRGMTHVNIM